MYYLTWSKRIAEVVMKGSATKEEILITFVHGVNCICIYLLLDLPLFTLFYLYPCKFLYFPFTPLPPPRSNLLSLALWISIDSRRCVYS